MEEFFHPLRDVGFGDEKQVSTWALPSITQCGRDGGHDAHGGLHGGGTTILQPTAQPFANVVQ